MPKNTKKQNQTDTPRAGGDDDDYENTRPNRPALIPIVIGSEIFMAHHSSAGASLRDHDILYDREDDTSTTSAAAAASTSNTVTTQYRLSREEERIIQDFIRYLNLDSEQEQILYDNFTSGKITERQKTYILVTVATKVGSIRKPQHHPSKLFMSIEQNTQRH